MGVDRSFRSGDRVVCVTESGRTGGPVFVLVHGLGMAHEYWDGLGDALEPTGLVLALDLPGFGDAPEPSAPLSMAESGELLAEFLAAEGRGRVVLVGHSTGAQVVAEAAARHPDLVDRVVLIGPSVNPRERTVPKQAARFLQDLALTSPKVVGAGVKAYAEAGPRWFARNLRPMIEHRIERVLPRVAAPTLVIRGEHDRIVPRPWAEEIARLLPDGRLVEVPGRGHETMVTAGAMVGELISRHAAGEAVGSVPPPADTTFVAGTAAGTGAPWTRAARWWAADYVYAGLRQLAVLGAGRRPRHWLQGDDRLPDVILLPGVYEHWTFLRPLGDALNRAGYRVRTVHGLGANRLSLDDTSTRLARALARRPAPPAGRVIVGHSKGGLIGKHLLLGDTRSEAGGELGLLGVVAVCTPFAGSRRARFFLDSSIRSLLPSDSTIVLLGRAATLNARIVSIFGTFDPHVPDGSVLEGATNMRVPVPGHFRPLGARETTDAVIQGLELLAG
ncbi:alpha/beta fold hydrolase [Agromyces sp. MMS24-JH15]|uniref:alpha/beta fold hydrolase n=1 Tax=Agromyces sp. MMS24-JH15 TaxID=3243765 RepID=UPI003748ABA3